MKLLRVFQGLLPADIQLVLLVMTLLLVGSVKAQSAGNTLVGTRAILPLRPIGKLVISFANNDSSLKQLTAGQRDTLAAIKAHGFPVWLLPGHSSDPFKKVLRNRSDRRNILLAEGRGRAIADLLVNAHLLPPMQMGRVVIVYWGENPYAPQQFVQATIETAARESLTPPATFLGFNQLSVAFGGSGWKGGSIDRSMLLPTLEVCMTHRDSAFSVYGGVGRDFKSSKPDVLGSRYDVMAYVGCEYLLWKGFGLTGQVYLARSTFSSGLYDGDWAESAGSWDFAGGIVKKLGRFNGRILFARPKYTLATESEGKKVNSLLLQVNYQFLR